MFKININFNKIFKSTFILCLKKNQQKSSNLETIRRYPESRGRSYLQRPVKQKNESIRKCQAWIKYKKSCVFY